MDNSQSASYNAGAAKGQAEEKSSGMMARAQDAAHGAAQSVQNAAHNASESAHEAGGQMQMKAGQTADAAKDATHRH